jgi:hypothetical protein
MEKQDTSRPRTGWWPLLAWGGDLHLLPGRGAGDPLAEEIRNANLARLDALVIPALRAGLPLYDSRSARRRAHLRRYPWQKRFRRSAPPPFEVAVDQAAQAGLRAWAQMDIAVAGLVDLSGPSIAQARPRWIIRNSQGRTTPVAGDRDHYFLCPTNLEVVRFLCEIAVEICTQFPIAALVLDQRTVPLETESGSTSMCLCFHCQERVAQDLGLDLQEVLDEGTAEIWEEWRRWRAGIWLDLIRTLRSKVWSIRPGLPLFVRSIPEKPESPPLLDPQPTPTWLDWARSGLIEMVLLDEGPGDHPEAERRLLESLPPEDLDCLLLPMFHEPPMIARPENWARAFRRSLPGWGLTRHLSEAWSTAILLKPGPRHGEASTQPAPEVEPLAACIEALHAAEQSLAEAPLAGDVRAACATLLSDGRTLDVEALESLIFQLSTLTTILDQEVEDPDGQVAVARGWVELARRLLRWHANLHCQELYLFDAG